MYKKLANSYNEVGQPQPLISKLKIHTCTANVNNNYEQWLTYKYQRLNI